MRVLKITPIATALAILALSALATPALAGQRVALVIGNASYAHVSRLANPVNDAADMGAALDRLGFAVTRIEDADYAELRRGLQQFALAASASEMAVVYYAGHGIEVDKRNFLIPVDARLLSDADVEFEAVPLDLLSRTVERAKGLRLIVLDACRDNPFAVAMQRAGATRSIGRGLAPVEPSGGTLVAYAAKEGTVASDGVGRNSPYTTALLAHLEEPGLELGLMFRKVRDAVLASTGGRQEPFVYGSLSSEGAYLATLPEPAPEPTPEKSTTVSKQREEGPVTEGLTPMREPAQVEVVFWESVRESTDPSDIQAYLDRYPAGAYASLAQNSLKRLAPSPPSDIAPSPPSNNEPVATESMVKLRLPTEGTWTANNSGWSIKLTRDGNQLVAGVRHTGVFGSMKCQGEFSDSGEIKGWCSGTQGFRKLRGTFPHVQLYYYGTFGANFVFDLDK